MVPRGHDLAARITRARVLVFGVPLSQAGDVRARNQINYNAGLEIIAHPRATLLLDIVGRRQLGGGMLEYRTEALGPYLADFLRVVPEAVDAVAFAPGIKWNVAANVLLSGNVLAFISNRGPACRCCSGRRVRMGVLTSAIS